MTKLSATVLFILSLSVVTVLAAESQVFKNSDLDKYSTGSSTQAVEPPPPPDKGRQPRNTGDGSVTSPTYWCDIATEADNRIKRAEENLTIANSNRAEAWRNLSSGIYSAAVEADMRSQKDLANAEAELVDAKQEKERIESEAHQKNVPAGWLRCQFE